MLEKDIEEMIKIEKEEQQQIADILSKTGVPVYKHITNFESVKRKGSFCIIVRDSSYYTVADDNVYFIKPNFTIFLYKQRLYDRSEEREIERALLLNDIRILEKSEDRWDPQESIYFITYNV